MRNEILKKKYLVNKETKILIENELSKILIQDLEQAREMTVVQFEQITKLESEV